MTPPLVPPEEVAEQPRVLIVAPFYPPAWRGGGPIRSLAAMTRQHGHRHRFAVLTSAFDWGGERLDVDDARWVNVRAPGERHPPENEPARAPGAASATTSAARVRYLPLAGLGSLTSVDAIRAWWRAWREATGGPSGAPDVTYFNGVFPPLWTILPLALRRLGVLRTGRVLIAPRGEFGQGALQLKARKKAWFLRAARWLGLFRGVAWHASTSAEEADLRAVLPNARVVMRQNETDLPDRARRPEPVPDEPGPLRIVYVGRLSPKKGVETLLEALPLVAEPVAVTVVGSAAEPEYDTHLRDLAARSPHPVEFTGGVEHSRVVEVLARHELFVFPTANENFGHTIAESLAAAVPVMVTAGATPWAELLGDNAPGALELPPDLDPRTWAARIDEYARRSPEQRLTAREAAASAYDAWRDALPRHSVFDLLLDPHL